MSTEKKKVVIPVHIVESEQFVILKFGQENIFGVPKSQPHNRAMLEFWKMWSERCFVSGVAAAQGISTWPDEEWYKDLDVHYKEWMKPMMKEIESKS